MRRWTFPAAAAILAVILAGCLVGPPGEAAQRTHGVTGAFATAAAPEDIEAVAARVEARGGELAFDGGRFVAEGLTRSACAEVQLFLERQDQVARVGACRDAADAEAFAF